MAGTRKARVPVAELAPWSEKLQSIKIACEL